MVNFTVREGDTSSFTYSYNGYNPVITVKFAAGTATYEDGYSGTRISSSISSINGYVYAVSTYSFGANVDKIDEADEQFTLEVYYNGILDEIVTITILDDLAWHGTDSSETWSGSANSDVYFAYAGADVVRGRGENDEIDGGQGHDWLIGGNGSDFLSGSAGNDTLDGGNGADVLFGGEGKDSLFGGSNKDTLTGDTGHDQILGGGGSDDLSGGIGNDFLSGGNGHDFLQGGNGADKIEGGKGRDKIDGGNGNDILTGGFSADTFVFTGKFGHDRIVDFEFDGREKIDLSDAVDIRNFKDLAENYATDTDDGVLIEISSKASILIEGVNISSFSGQDFIF